MDSKSFRIYVFLLVLAVFVVVPLAKKVVQEESLKQDIRSIQIEYSLRGPEYFRKRLDEIVVNARLDPKDVAIRIEENKSKSRVLVEIRYLSRMKILFFPIERPVVVRREFPLLPLE